MNQAVGARRGRVGLVLGCVQRCFDPAVNAATVAVLQANGFEVVIPKEQGCCGAASHHQGQMEQTRELAADLVRRFQHAGGAEQLDAVLVQPPAAATPQGLWRDPERQQPFLRLPRAGRARILGGTRPESRLPALLKPLQHADGSPASAARPLTVAYHDACHMIHGQGITGQPRQLLQAIPHLQLREATEAGVCCGSAGIYNLVQPEEAAELGRIKVDDLTERAPS